VTTCFHSRLSHLHACISLSLSSRYSSYALISRYPTLSWVVYRRIGTFLWYSAEARRVWTIPASREAVTLHWGVQILSPLKKEQYLYLSPRRERASGFGCWLKLCGTRWGPCREKHRSRSYSLAVKDARRFRPQGWRLKAVVSSLRNSET
jgi:hypothetical protein